MHSTTSTTVLTGCSTVIVAAGGRKLAPLTVTGSLAIPEDEVKNGNTPFSVMTIAPDPIIPRAPDCSNPNWTETIDDLGAPGWPPGWFTST